MSWTDWLRSIVSKPARRSDPHPVPRAKARYDASENSRWLENYYSGVSSTSANAELYEGKRKTIRDRARFELRNNSWACGMVETRAQYTIGTGPHPQIAASPEVSRALEDMWRRWARREKLGQMLRLAMRQICGETGEVLIVKSSREKSDDGLPRLRLTLVEADRLTTPMQKIGLGPSLAYEDGVAYDTAGEPVSYDVLDVHPGDSYVQAATSGYTTYSVDDAIHLYRAIRPGQRRGIPDITPALPLFALLRRFSLSTILAAEAAASFSGMLTADSDEAENYLPFETLDFEPGQWMTLPKGVKAVHMVAEHPTQNHEMFTKLLLNEISRCLHLPLNLAMLNSAGYNYSSGRLDHQASYKTLDVDHDWLELGCVDEIWRSFFEEASLLLPGSEIDGIDWRWDGYEHVDPKAEADAEDVALRNGSTHLAAVYMKKGLDPEEELRKASQIRMLQDELAAQEEANRQNLAKKYGIQETTNVEQDDDAGGPDEDSGGEPDGGGSATEPST